MAETPVRRFARIEHRGVARWAEIDAAGEAICLHTGSGLPDPSWEVRFRPLDAPLRFLTPFCGRNVVGLAYNYRGLVGDAARDEEPLLFLKGAHSASVVGGREAGTGRVPLPSWVGTTWAEAELGVVIGRACFDATVEEARASVLGFCVASDLTTFNVHERDHHLARSKALPGFAPLSPYVVSGIDPCDLAIETHVDGHCTQRSRTSDMICDPFEAVSLASQVVPLVPGDLVLTGTPAGAMESRVRLGSRVVHQIAGVGRLDFEMVQPAVRRGSGEGVGRAVTPGPGPSGSLAV